MPESVRDAVVARTAAVEPVPVEQLGHGGPAERRELEPARVRGADQVAEHGAQRVRGTPGLR